jgi:hypothetical protein
VYITYVQTDSVCNGIGVLDFKRGSDCFTDVWGQCSYVWMLLWSAAMDVLSIPCQFIVQSVLICSLLEGIASCMTAPQSALALPLWIIFKLFEQPGATTWRSLSSVSGYPGNVLCHIWQPIFAVLHARRSALSHASCMQGLPAQSSLDCIHMSLRKHARVRLGGFMAELLFRLTSHAANFKLLLPNGFDSQLVCSLVYTVVVGALEVRRMTVLPLA